MRKSHHAKKLASELLSDVRCRTRLAPRLMPYLYTGLVGVIAYALAWLVAACFERAAWLGWLHALVVAPVGLLVGAMWVRAMLEFGMAVLEIRDHAQELGRLPQRVSTWPAMRRIVAFGESRVWAAGRRERVDD